MSAVSSNPPPPLAAPPRYCPWQRNADSLDTGLYRFGHDFGNGAMDGHLFQFDQLFAEYRQNLVANRAEPLGRYICEQDLSAELQQCINRFVIERLHREHPPYFRHSEQNRIISLSCLLTGETLRFSRHGELVDHNSAITPPYLNGLDALASQCQEDFAILQREHNGDYRVKALHLNCPNHWGADTRIGMNFEQLHAPVPGFAQRHTQTKKLLDGLLQRGPYTRFVWGMTDNRQLNQHPAHVARQDSSGNDLQLRIERQVLWGFPEQAALLFTIRTLFLAAAELDRGEQDSLCTAIVDMPTALLEYKASKQVQQLVQQFCSKR
jgi:hypothetical protein